MSETENTNNNTSNSHVDDLTFYSLLSLLQGGMWLLNDIEIFLKKYNISYGRFAILLAIVDSKNKSIRPIELANIMGKSKPTISKMVKKLQADGLIEINHHQKDGRSITVNLLDKGKNILQKIIPEYNRRILTMSSLMTDDDKRDLIMIISKIKFYNPYQKVIKKNGL